MDGEKRTKKLVSPPIFPESEVIPSQGHHECFLSVSLQHPSSPRALTVIYIAEDSPTRCYHWVNQAPWDNTPALVAATQ